MISRLHVAAKGRRNDIRAGGLYSVFQSRTQLDERRLIMNWWSRFSVTISKRMSLPTTLHECHTVKKPMDAYFYQCAHCGNSSPFIAALQQPIRLAIPVRQPAPVSSSRKETGAPTAAAAHLVQGFAAFPLVTIGVTNTEVTSNSDADDDAADQGMDCT